MSNQEIETFELSSVTKHRPSHQQIPEAEKNRHFLFFCFIDFVVFLGQTYLYPFYPPLATSAKMSFAQIGLTYTVNSIGYIGFTIPLGKFVTVFGKKKGMITALFIQTCVFTLNGSLQFMTESTNLFLGMSLFSRFFQGLCRSLFKISIYAYINFYWPADFQKKFAQNEVIGGIGNALGPLIGTLLNFGMGFAGPLYVYAGIILVTAIVTIKWIEADEFHHDIAHEGQGGSIARVLINPKVLILILLILMTLGGLGFPLAFLVNHLETYGIDPNYTAIVMFMPSILYICLIPLIPGLRKYFLNSFTVSLGLLIAIIATLIQQPFWGVADTAVPAIIGMMISGASQPFYRVPCIPLFKQYLMQIYDLSYPNDEINQMASSLFTFGIGLPNLIMPSLGGILYDNFLGPYDNTNTDPTNYYKERKSFRHTYQVYTVLQIIVFVLYLLFAEGYIGWKAVCNKCRPNQLSVDEKIQQKLLEEQDKEGEFDENDKKIN